MHAIRKLRESGHATVADYEKASRSYCCFSQSRVDTDRRRSCGSAKIFATSLSTGWFRRQNYMHSAGKRVEVA
jgi:hypothetical protein